MYIYVCAPALDSDGDGASSKAVGPLTQTTPTSAAKKNLLDPAHWCRVAASLNLWAPFKMSSITDGFHDVGATAERHERLRNVNAARWWDEEPPSMNSRASHTHLRGGSNLGWQRHMSYRPHGCSMFLSAKDPLHEVSVGCLVIRVYQALYEEF